MEENLSKELPLVSVVMANYNNARFLPEAIESVLAQTYRNFEFFIVDDGSTDNSSEVIKTYLEKDSRIHYIQNERNLGQSETRNKAIRLAQGEYVAIVDSDDICLPNRLEVQINFLRKNLGIDVLGSSYCLFFNNREDECETKVSADVHDLQDGTPPVHNPTCMIKRKTFIDHAYYDSGYDNAEDYELWLRWFSEGVRFENMSEVLYKKRTHSGSVSISKIKRQIYLMLKINLKAVFRYRVRFTTQGYIHILEQFLYLVYLVLGLNRIYAKGRVIK